MRRPRKRTQKGQVLVFFTLVLIVLLGFAGLAIDVSRVYAEARMEHAVADAAALAGAQDLQIAGTRTVGDPERARARAHALQILADQLGGTASCNTLSDISGCPIAGTPYVVSVKTPAPTCLAGGCSVDAYHAVQVTVRNPAYPVTFVRLFGIDSWDVGRTSVAGMRFSAKYAIVTLRGPCPNPHQPLDPCADDLNLNGTNTVLNVLSGDVGSNTTVTTNSGARVNLAPGYLIYHIDDSEPWNGASSGNPAGQLITQFIQDPNYSNNNTLPARPTSPTTTYRSQADGVVSCSGAGVPSFVTDMAATGYTVTCYKPGVYQKEFDVLGNKTVAYLTNSSSAGGAYFFDGGAKVTGTLYGGLVSNQPGVVIVVANSKVTFAGNNAVNIWLNRGDIGCNSDTCRATPALDYLHNLVQTPAPHPMVLSLMVTRVSGCFALNGDPLTTCSPSSVLNLPGNSNVFIAGVVYAPTDDSAVEGNLTSTVGTVGQLITWTTTYSGGAQLNQEYPGGQEPGILRLDAACTAPGTPCVP